MALLREDPKEFAGLRRRLDRTFAPRDEPERKLLRRLAEALWRRLRLFRAQARWETDALQAFLGSCPRAKALSPDLARRRAFGLMSILLDQDRLAERSDWLLRRIEHMLRFLLRKRLGHEDPEFKGIVLERCRGLKELEALENEQATERALARLLAGGPEVERIIEQSMPAWWLRKYRRQQADGRRQQEQPQNAAARASR